MQDDNSSTQTTGSPASAMGLPTGSKRADVGAGEYTTTNARKVAPHHREFDERYKISGADYRNVFGELLWQERPYQFKRLSGIGETFVHDYVEYRVHRCAIGQEGVIQYNIVCIS